MAEKKLDNLTKYYLCSEHFVDEDMLNPEVADKSFLRLKKVNNDVIPLPTIFEDNLLRNVQTAQQNAEKFSTYIKPRMADSSRPRVGKRQNEQRSVYTVREIKKPRQEQQIICTTEIVHSDFLAENLLESKNDDEEFVDINSYCRLCARVCIDLISIFDELGNYHIETDCFRLMPQNVIVKDDGLPQSVCGECLEKLQAAANVVDGFVTNQNFFVVE